MVGLELFLSTTRALLMDGLKFHYSLSLSLSLSLYRAITDGGAKVFTALLLSLRALLTERLMC